MVVEAFEVAGAKKQDVSFERPISLIALNQTFVCFDLESREDAIQQIEIRRTVDSDIAWRVRTNAPTRYIVNPNSGKLSASCSVAKVTIQLVNNNYHPSHEIIVQAVQLSDDNIADVWSSQCAKILSHIQTIKLELATTIVNFDVPPHDIEVNKTLLEKILLRNGLSREDKVKELSEMLQMLEADCAAIQSNIAKAERLKEMLKKTIQERKLDLQKYKDKCSQQNRELTEYKRKATRMDEQPICSLS